MADKGSPHNCQSCVRTDSAESEMVQCDVCKLWEHFGCAGVGEEIRQTDATYRCGRCLKQVQSNDDHLKVPVVETRSCKGSKTASKVGSRKGKKNLDLANSATSSVRVALLAEQLKLVDDEQKLEEQALLEEEELKQRLFEEEERQLEERNRLRERKLQQELELRRKQQQVRKESFEKRQTILRQVAETSSRGNSVLSSDQRVEDWLDGQDVGRSDGIQLGGKITSSANKIPEDPSNHCIPLLSSIPQQSILPNPHLDEPLLPNFSHQMQRPRVSVTAPEYLPAPSSAAPVPTSMYLAHTPLRHNPNPLYAASNPQSFPVSPPQPTPTVPVSSVRTLSQPQIAAGQVLGKDLPTFSGNPED